MRSYWRAIILSITGHTLLIALAIWGWEASTKKPSVTQPHYIQATLIELKPKEKTTTTPKTQSKPKPKPTPKKKNKPKPKLQDNLSEKKQLEKKKQQQKKRAEQQRKQEQQRKNQLAKKKVEEKKKQAEALKYQQELEKKRQTELEQQALMQALAEEKARLDAEKQAAEDDALVQSYIALMADRVEQNWSRPPSARNGMEVLLRIQLVPTGQVIRVDVIQGSGDSAFDRSAIRAVKRADRFPELKDVPARIFEQQFRTLTFSFSPEDLRQ
ncbi:protein TolA [Candidatus Endobugula sertula]|uniref:Protein TolA n=1 Tax=Candidatus Endobugula sertula TaxID=62101 RepID=A0A1D2QLZ2_9GAMM|nr:protein TolA [Candidatus Endobugula sertula]